MFGVEGCGRGGRRRKHWYTRATAICIGGQISRLTTILVVLGCFIDDIDIFDEHYCAGFVKRA